MDQNYKPEIHWDQTAFEELRASWSPERIAEDEKTLSDIFKLAADSPLLAEELAWAKEHNIKFFVDRAAVNCAGYYWPGSGVMAVADKYMFQKAYTVEVIAHELRHAWQDYHGFMAWNDQTPNTGDFSRFFINNALMEADALAFGERARDEFTASQIRKSKQPVPAGLQASLADENTDLGKKFLSWFDWRHLSFYGDFFSKKHGRKWGVYDGASPARNYEHQPAEPQLAGLNIDNIQDVLRLGQNFSGTKNYLAALQPDILPKKILRPSLANTFWGAANSNQRKLTGKLRKASLKKELAPENRKLRHPWP